MCSRSSAGTTGARTATRCRASSSWAVYSSGEWCRGGYASLPWAIEIDQYEIFRVKNLTIPDCSLFVANPGWAVRHPRQFATELTERVR